MGHTETVLLVNDYSTQLCELHSVLDDGVCANQYMHITGAESVENLLTLLALHDASKQFYADRHAFQELTNALQVLLCQDFRRCHHAGLITIVQGNEHGHQGHQCLSATHVALQQAVHLTACAHILADLVHHPFLCACQCERQVLLVEVVEQRTDAIEHKTTVFASLVAGIP